MLSYLLIDLLRNTEVIKEYINISKEVAQGYDFLEDNKRKKLVKLLHHLLHHPFYKTHISDFEQKTIAQDPYGILAQIPIVSKQQISAASNWFTANDKQKNHYEKRYTGGSTGSPFNYYLSKYSISRITAFNYFLWNHYLGYKIGDRILAIGGNSLGQNANYKVRLYNFLQRKNFISGDIINENELTSALNFITEDKYDVIYAYPSSLEFFVDEAMRRNISFKKKIKGVITTSEMLSEEALKKFQSFFKCEVLNCYGARDGGIIGCEQRNNDKGFYFNFFDCHVESVVIDKQLGKSELILTNLGNYSFPFVRYKVGDIGVIEKHTGESKLPLDKIIHLQGRTRDLIFTHSNKVIHGSAFNATLKSITAIEQYQIIQDSDFNLEIRIKSTEISLSEDLIVNRLRSLINDPNIGIKVSVNREFVLSENQKHKTVVSYVS